MTCANSKNRGFFRFGWQTSSYPVDRLASRYPVQLELACDNDASAETRSPVKASQCSGHLYCSKPWIHTFWPHCSSRWCWLALSGYLVTHGRCCTMDHKAFWHLENHEWQSQFWPFLLDQTMTMHTFGAHYSGTDCWMTPTGHLFTHGRCSTMDHRALPHLENHFSHKCQ